MFTKKMSITKRLGRMVEKHVKTPEEAEELLRAVAIIMIQGAYGRQSPIQFTVPDGPDGPYMVLAGKATEAPEETGDEEDPAQEDDSVDEE